MIDLVEISGKRIRPESIQYLNTDLNASIFAEWFESAAPKWIEFIKIHSNFYVNNENALWNFEYLTMAIMEIPKSVNENEYGAGTIYSALEIQEGVFRDFMLNLNRKLWDSFEFRVEEIIKSNKLNLSNDEMDYIQSTTYFGVCLFDWIHDYSTSKYETHGESDFIHFIMFASGIYTVCTCKVSDGLDPFMTFDSVNRFMSTKPFKTYDIEVSAKDSDLWRGSFIYFCKKHPEFDIKL